MSWDLKTGISEFFGKVRLVEEIEIDRYGNLTCKQSCSVADAHDVICFDKNNKLVGSIKSPGELTALAVRLDEGQLATANDTSIFIWNIKTQKLIATLKTKFGVQSLSLSPDGLLVATEMYGLIEFFDPVAAYKNVASIDLPDMGATGVSAYWNDYGYLTGIGLDRIVDIKCEIKKQLVDPLSSSVNRDPAGIVVSYLFPPVKKNEKADGSWHEVAEIKLQPQVVKRFGYQI